MSSVSQGNSVTIIVPADRILEVSTAGEASVTIEGGRTWWLHRAIRFARMLFVRLHDVEHRHDYRIGRIRRDEAVEHVRSEHPIFDRCHARG
ncbi:hypothetical protein E4K66_30395 [Bradyrhizobium frederickii]|uniref:Uncharacterized protein n=1 Tax=Bradyrhizobium frederickii TaxID=2560054 RepID=A0A4Y9KTI5_9BRAD|nr:hypothetical protein [Bradyrhizobium frederickii]TFV34708.1 hypothetical protein E4K66_30395 [Bradyrhizobium frederickii]